MNSPSPKKLMSVLFDDVWNQKKLTKLKTIAAENVIIKYPGAAVRGLKNFHNMIVNWQIAFPDIQHEIQEIITSGNNTVVRWRGNGTHLGNFNGWLPTGYKMSYSGITIFKIKNNKIQSAWVNADIQAILTTIKTYSQKKYTAKDFSIDMNGPASKIYNWNLKARPTPSCKQMMANSMREIFAVMPADNQPEIIIPPALLTQVEREEVWIPSQSGKVRTLIYKPKKSKKKYLPILIYMHGGGWSIANPEASDLITRKLAYLANIMVISIDYRLAPEHPYPAGLDDCMAVYYWTRAHGKKVLHANPDKIAVGGDSCGGNLAPAMILRSRDEGKPVPDALLALCPLTDFLFEKYASAVKLGPNSLVYDFAFASFVRSIYSPYALWQHPYISPMYGDLHHFPTTFILIAGQDLLTDENILFAQKLQAAGNEVELLIHEEMPHAYYYYLGLTKEEKIAYQAMTKFLRRVLF